MLSNLVQLTHQIENKTCHFTCENDTPLHLIKEALFQFQKFIGTVEDTAKAQRTDKPVDPNLTAVETPVSEAEPVALQGNENV